MGALSQLKVLHLDGNDSLAYPPFSLKDIWKDTVAHEVVKYCRTHKDTVTRYGKWKNMWSIIRLMYIGNLKGDESIFSSLPIELLIVIEDFLLYDQP